MLQIHDICLILVLSAITVAVMTTALRVLRPEDALFAHRNDYIAMVCGVIGIGSVVGFLTILVPVKRSIKRMDLEQLRRNLLALGFEPVPRASVELYAQDACGLLKFKSIIVEVTILDRDQAAVLISFYLWRVLPR